VQRERLNNKAMKILEGAAILDLKGVPEYSIEEELDRMNDKLGKALLEFGSEFYVPQAKQAKPIGKPIDIKEELQKMSINQEPAPQKQEEKKEEKVEDLEAMLDDLIS